MNYVTPQREFIKSGWYRLHIHIGNAIVEKLIVKVQYSDYYGMDYLFEMLDTLTFGLFPHDNCSFELIPLPTMGIVVSDINTKYRDRIKVSPVFKEAGGK